MECSMCGDVGFAEHLFQCRKCRFRFQHKYCSRGYFYGDHIELCDWCFVESDQSGGSTDNFHPITNSKPTLKKNVDGKRSNASNSLKRKGDEASAFSLKRKRDEARLTVECNDRKANMAAGLMRSVSKTSVQNTRLVPPRSRQRMKLLHEILC
uniref:PHD-type zinc finger plants domain-containing protein n=1 Tax=Picea sitchensis TaxID=3332 RepID=A9NTY6_PICSI|nr:unknown [Picea sitchensis]